MTDRVDTTSPRGVAVMAKDELGPLPSAAPTLRRLFLTLFLRGRSARGLRKETAPKSIGWKLGGTLGMYGLVGLVAVTFARRPVFAIAVYLHAMTFVFLGMFVAASAGEVLFNSEEGDILLHRPIAPKALLWAKIRVLVEVSLWIAGAFNIAGLVVGLSAPDGSVLFPLVHVVSTALEALFCTGCVVLMYQLCLRWFGREKLEGVMTAAQVLLSVGAVLGGQLLPQLVIRSDHVMKFTAESWWIALLPPAWFAGLDDFFAGTAAAGSGLLALFAVVATGAVLALAFGKLSQSYEVGLQTLNERSAKKVGSGRGRGWVNRLAGLPPLRWWLRDPVVRASFLLVTAYLLRDRDVKLRIYPGIAPILVMPLVFVVQGRGGTGAFGSAFAAAYLGLIPLLAISILQHSQGYQAADVFRAAPLENGAKICAGERIAVALFLTLPMVLVSAGIILVIHREVWQLALLLPGLIAVPVFSVLPHVGGAAVPFSRPTEEAKSASRGFVLIAAMVVALVIAGITNLAWTTGWFGVLLLVETPLCVGVYLMLRSAVKRAPWAALE